MSSALYLLLHLILIGQAVVLLWKGADWFIDGAVRIARRLRVSDLVIGLTLVGLATSAPEFAVSVRAALSGHTNISAANVVGSNIFNLGFILGGCAAIRPIMTSRTLVYRDGIFLISVTLLLTFFARDLKFSGSEGVFLMGLLVVYLVGLFIKKEPIEKKDPIEKVGASDKPATTKDVAIAAVGFVMIVIGGELLVSSSIVVARAFGMSEWAIGVTVVAAGTSAPELVTSLNAAVKGHYGISAGNLIGSDLFNLLGVLGLAAFLRPLAMDPAGQTSLLVLNGMVILVVVFLRTGWRLSRLEGSTLVLINVVRWVFDMSNKSP